MLITRDAGGDGSILIGVFLHHKGRSFSTIGIRNFAIDVGFSRSRNGEGTMDKEHAKGGLDKAKGAVKDAVGSATGNEKLQAEGKADKAKGSAHEAAGDVKDAGKK